MCTGTMGCGYDCKQRKPGLYSRSVCTNALYGLYHERRSCPQQHRHTALAMHPCITALVCARASNRHNLLPVCPAAEFEGRDGGNDNDVDDEFDDDAEAVKGMARLFCEVAEAYIQLILAATPQVSIPYIACWAGACSLPLLGLFGWILIFWVLSGHSSVSSRHACSVLLQHCEEGRMGACCLPGVLVLVLVLVLV